MCNLWEVFDMTVVMLPLIIGLTNLLHIVGYSLRNRLRNRLITFFFEDMFLFFTCFIFIFYGTTYF